MFPAASSAKTVIVLAPCARFVSLENPISVNSLLFRTMFGASDLTIVTEFISLESSKAADRVMLSCLTVLALAAGAVIVISGPLLSRLKVIDCVCSVWG